jgi:hypothetical protein
MRARLFIWPLILLAACQKAVPEPTDKKMFGDVTSLCLDTRYVSHSGTELFIETDVAILYSGDGQDNTSFSDSIFRDTSFATNDLYVESVERLILAENRSYSNLLLLDQSEFLYVSDSYNRRIRCLNKAVTEGKENGSNQIAIANYARDGIYEDGVKLWSCDTCANPYNQSRDELGKIIYESYYDRQGTSNMYDAIYMLIDSVAFYTPAANRNITVVAHSLPDADNSVSMSVVANKAIANDVKINLILMAPDPASTLLQLPVRTGGFAWNIDGYEKTSNFPVYEGGEVICALDRLLARNLHIYRVQLRLVKSSNWNSGSFVYNQWQTLQYDNDGGVYLNNYIPLYAKIP